MDFQAVYLAPNPSAAALHDAAIDKEERNEVIIARSYTNVTEYEKVSDPSNTLKENSHPLQGTRTPALQRPLTQRDDDSTHAPATISPILPRELVERVFLLLGTKSIQKCRLVNREFNAIAQSSTVQYYLACRAAGVVDNPQSPLSRADRLEALKKREDAWRKLKPVFETTIKPIDEPSSMWYKLAAGMCFCSDKNQTNLYYCHLPSSPEDNAQWFRIPSQGPGQSQSPGFIVDTGLAVYEHDLIVNVISSEIENQASMQRHSLDLVLLKLSTREYHPLANHPLIHVQISSARTYSAFVRIAGDNLALVVYDPDNESKLFIFDWKTGNMRLQHKTTNDAYNYSVPVFVSPELLLVPNRILCLFEVWHLFPSRHNPKSPAQILSFKLPAGSGNYFGIDCQGELSPSLHFRPYFPSRPFFPSENSIIIVKIRTGLRGGHTFIMHRRALLDMIQTWTSPSSLGQQEGLPKWLTNKVTVYEFVDPDDESVRFSAQSELISEPSPRTRDTPTLATPQISPTSPTSHISVDSGSSSIYSGSVSSTSEYNVVQVKWADWGPPVSRWFRVSGPYAMISQSFGQRHVFLDYNAREAKFDVAVADFNLHNIRRNTETMGKLSREGENTSGNSNNEEAKKGKNDGLEILHHRGAFSEEVYMGLKYVVSHTPVDYRFGSVLIDEERLVGLKRDEESRITSIKVLYFG